MLTDKRESEILSQKISDLRRNQIPYILFFSKPDCTLCEATLSQLMDLIRDYPIELISLDALQNPTIAGQYRVFVEPTIVLFSEGKEALRESRRAEFDRLKCALDFMQTFGLIPTNTMK